MSVEESHMDQLRGDYKRKRPEGFSRQPSLNPEKAALRERLFCRLRRKKLTFLESLYRSEEIGAASASTTELISIFLLSPREIESSEHARFF